MGGACDQGACLLSNLTCLSPVGAFPADSNKTWMMNAQCAIKFLSLRILKIFFFTFKIGVLQFVYTPNAYIYNILSLKLYHHIYIYAIYVDKDNVLLMSRCVYIQYM